MSNLLFLNYTDQSEQPLEKPQEIIRIERLSMSKVNILTAREQNARSYYCMVRQDLHL